MVTLKLTDLVSEDTARAYFPTGWESALATRSSSSNAQVEGRLYSIGWDTLDEWTHSPLWLDPSTGDFFTDEEVSEMRATMARFFKTISGVSRPFRGEALGSINWEKLLADAGVEYLTNGKRVPFVKYSAMVEYLNR